MKRIKRVLAIVVVAMSVALPASAQFRFGIKAGAAISKLSLDKEVLSSDNRGGFTGGIMAEFTVPVIGIGMDASVLYAQRSIDVVSGEMNYGGKDTRSYIDIPVNFKFKLALPVISKIITPFVTTGPDFSFLCSKQNFNDAWTSRKFDVAWNAGLGVELFRHLQVAASYGFGLTNSASGDEALFGGNLFKGKNRFWTVTLAYLF